jgi:hypothetical protein
MPKNRKKPIPKKQKKSKNIPKTKKPKKTPMPIYHILETKKPNANLSYSGNKKPQKTKRKQKNPKKPMPI